MTAPQPPSVPRPVPLPTPLSGVRVLDIATLIAAPTCARILADFGADVVKVERPGSGDGIRAFEFAKNDVSLWWKCIGRNKRPMTLDLKHPEGLEVFGRLVDHADVLVENFRPGTLERLGIGPDVLHARNPGLVIVRVSGYGQDGPYARRPGFGTLAEAYSGYAELCGYPDRPPLLPPIALADELTGQQAAIATMMALYHRDVHGADGQVIDAALFESLFSILGPIPSTYQQLGISQERAGSRLGFTAPRNTYCTADGRWVALAGSSQTIAERIFTAIEQPQLFADERFADNRARLQNLDALDEVIADWIGRHDLDTVLARFDECEAAVAPTHDMAGIFDDEHYLSRGTVTYVDDDELGTLAMQEVVPRLSATPGAIRHAGLPMGACTDEVLAELGYDAEEIARLHRDGAV